jgi:molybdate transport system permease protein
VRTAVDAVLTLPLVLPPTDAGSLLVVRRGRHGRVGRPLRWLTGGYTLSFRPEGDVIAATVVALPLRRTCRPALRSPASTRLGSRRPAQRRERAGAVLARQPAAGPPRHRPRATAGVRAAHRRVRATDMVMGNVNGRQTLPIAVYNQTLNGDLAEASHAVWLLTGLSLGIVLV